MTDGVVSGCRRWCLRVLLWPWVVALRWGEKLASLEKGLRSRSVFGSLALGTAAEDACDEADGGEEGAAGEPVVPGEFESVHVAVIVTRVGERGREGGGEGVPGLRASQRAGSSGGGDLDVPAAEHSVNGAARGWLRALIRGSEQV